MGQLHPPQKKVNLVDALTVAQRGDSSMIIFDFIEVRIIIDLELSTSINLLYLLVVTANSLLQLWGTVLELHIHTST